MTSEEIAWLAGFLEGEGSFISRPNGGIAVSAASTDLDVLERVKSIIGGNVYKITNRHPEKWKQAWVWRTGDRQLSRSLLQQILPYMGTRRSERINELLSAYRLPQGHPGLPSRFCQVEDCDRLYQAKGYCHKHYMSAHNRGLVGNKNIGRLL